jgi:hypothetical protein
MQLIWIGGPADRIVSFSWTARRMGAVALLTTACLVGLGASMQLMGVRVAIDYAPDLARSMGGVISESQLQNLHEQHAQQMQTIQARMGQLQSQLQTLQASQMQWLQGLGWKGAEPLAGEKLPAWVLTPGQGGPLRLLPKAPWSPEPSPRLLAQQDLERTEQAVNLWAQAWQQKQEKLAQLPLSSPLTGEFGLSSRFGVRSDPITRAPAFHEGLDFIAPRLTPVLVTAPGRVVRSEYSGAYGQMVEVAHADHFVTRYAHLDKRHVEVGQNVQRGQSLGLLGNSGRSTGPHLHYEVLYKNRHTNPEAPLLALWQDRR